MMTLWYCFDDSLPGSGRQGSESGFSLAEFLISAVVVLVLSGAVFNILTEVRYTAGHQAERQAVLQNTCMAMETVGRYIRQAGNDPHHRGLTAVAIIGPTAIRIQSDHTGSKGPGNPDKGDPDGDADDAGESLTIRYNSRAQTVEVVPEGGSALIIASHISEFSFQYFDSSGKTTEMGQDVRKIRLTISGAGMSPDPRTRRSYSMRLSSEIQILPL